MMRCARNLILGARVLKSLTGMSGALRMSSPMKGQRVGAAWARAGTATWWPMECTMTCVTEPVPASSLRKPASGPTELAALALLAS